MSTSLRASTIRLAYAKPELRSHLLPLLKEAAVRTPEEKRKVVQKGAEFFDRVEELLSGRGTLERSGSMLSFRVKKKWTVADLDYDTWKVTVRNWDDQKKRVSLDPRKVADLMEGMIDSTFLWSRKEAAVGKMAALSRTQAVYLKGIFEGSPVGTRPIPKKTFDALSARGLVTGGEDVSMINTGRYGLVSATLTPKGREVAIQLFREEHEERVREGLKSERIPNLLRQRGVEV